MSDAGDAHTQLSADGSLPIDFTDCDDVKCHLCGVYATSPSPLTSMCTLVASAHCVPWMKYLTKYSDDGNAIAKYPYGNFCAICRNTGRCTGLLVEHKGMKEVYQHLSKPENASQSRQFITLRKKWIHEHNESPENGARLRAGRDFTAEWTKLTATKSASRELYDDNMEFVEKEHWDSQLDGEWDESKAMEEETDLGVFKKGAYVLRGRAGVHKLRKGLARTHNRTTVLDDGRGPFAEMEQEAKEKAVRGAMQASDKARADNCVVAKTRAMDSAGLLSLLEGAGLASGHVGGSRMSESSTTLPEEADDDEPSDDERPSSSKLFGLFSPAVTNKKTPAGSPMLYRLACQAKPKASPKASPKAGTGAAAALHTPSPVPAEKAERTIRCRCLWCCRPLALLMLAMMILVVICFSALCNNVCICAC